MVPFKKLGLVGFSLLILIACEPDDPPLIDQYPEEEQLVTGTWRYDSVMVKGHSFYHATNKMLPGTNIAGSGWPKISARQEVSELFAQRELSIDLG